ncbi:hypothetical protein PGB28_08035 [Primorskyibacter aestuariivivens]|uniref:COG3904 family protein n=1 Tax=Primorskyibacter aestuariivivens TaxID=1888912 RepID=UPI0022FFDB8D|nr:hypothetical protein [Primorskyibacter aestuariivivens]MDA7428405.1 hypothetical protein [Primorskyibacter aestuariivivens]
MSFSFNRFATIVAGKSGTDKVAIMRVNRFLCAVLAAVAPVLATAAPMVFDHGCIGNAVEGCYLVGVGEISRDTPEELAAFIDVQGVEGNQILLDSNGGNLGAGIRMGRIIRENDMTAIVGAVEPRKPGGRFPLDLPTAGTCASACAYAFLGGTTRRLAKGSKLGFHQFYMGVQGASSSAQQVSGQLVSYLVEMGVDPRIFAKASSQGAESMYWVPEDEAESFDLITPYGYDDFFLEPYGKGVVAAAKRKTPTGPYDLVHQVTAYCRKGTATLLFTADFAPERSSTFNLSLDGRKRVINAAKVASRRTDNAGYLEVRLSSKDAVDLTKATLVETYFDYSRAEGWGYGTRLELNDMDRKMLDAAFRLCL